MSPRLTPGDQDSSDGPEILRVGTLLDAVLEPDLRRITMTRGVYVLRCAECDFTVYAGKADDIYGRLIQHAFGPPYGVVDIVIGDVVLPQRRFERFCVHLHEIRRGTRSEIARALRLEISIVPDGQSTAAREDEIRRMYEAPYGDGRRMWRPVEELLDYLMDPRLHRDLSSGAEHPARRFDPST